MTEKKATRLSKAAREFNVGISTIVEFLQKKGHDVNPNPNTKLDPELYVLLVDEYSTDLNVKKESEKLTMQTFRDKQESIQEEEVPEPEKVEKIVRTRRTRKPAPEKSDNPCPHGHKFGVDTDEKDECASCEKWDDCMDEKEKV